MKKTWIIAGGVVVVAAAAAPLAVGMLTEQHWQTATEDFNLSQPYFVIETDQYDRGYLSSEINGQLYFVDPETGERQPLGWTGDVSHGVTSSSILFNADVSDEDEFNELFPDEKPTLKVTTNAWGTSILELDVPAIDFMDEAAGESLNMSRSYSTMEISSGGEQMSVDLQVPGLVLRAPDMRMSIENLSMDQDATLLTGQLWTGEGTMTVDSFSVAARDEPEVIIDGLKVVSDTRPVKDDEAFSIDSKLTVDRVSHGDESYGPHSLEFQVLEVDVAAWNEMMEAAQTVQQLTAAPTDDPQVAFQQQMQATMAMTGSMEKLMARGLSIVMDLDVSSPEGPVTGHLGVSHPEQPDTDRVPLMLIAKTIEGELNLRVPMALAEAYPDLGAQLTPMIAQGALVEDGDFYVMDASLKDMMINLNGQEMPIPVPGMGGSPMMQQ